MEKSAECVEKSTGVLPSLDDPDLRARLQDARKMRVRQQAKETSKWNAALDGMAEQVEPE